MPRDAVETDLLAAIAAEPDAIEPRLIYGDWLLAQGDPRGELIAVQAARIDRPDELQLEIREAELVKQLTSELHAGAKITPGAIRGWHLGFVDHLHLAVRDIRLLRATDREWFAQPPFAAIRDLDIDSKYARNLRFIGQTQIAGTLRRLGFGDKTLALDAPTLDAIVARAPRITGLTLRATEVPDLLLLQRLPLTTFALHVWRLTAEGLERIMQAPWRLERFAIRTERDVDAELLPVLDQLYNGSALATVKHYAVGGGMPVIGVIEMLGRSKRATTVESFTADWQRVPYGTQQRAEPFREVLKNVKFFPVLGTSTWADTEQCVTLGGFLNYRLDRPADGLVYYQRALRISPEHVSARHNLGIALRKLKRHDESLAAFDQIISQSKAPAASLYNGRHYTLCELGRRAEARADLERAVQIEPNYADAWNNLGCERQYVGDADGALEAFRRCMQIDADHGYARKNEADLLLELGRASEALPIYAELLRQKPGNGPLLAMQAYAQFETGDLASARATLDARLFDPQVEYPNRLNVLRALVLQALGNATAARADLESCATRTDCPSWFALTMFVRGLADRDTWLRAVPDAAVTSKELVAAIVAHGAATRPPSATAMHEASVDDQLDIAELATAMALRANDRELALRRARAMAALYVEQGPQFHRSWWQTLATAATVVKRGLDNEARALLDLAGRAVRGRRPIAELLTLVA